MRKSEFQVIEPMHKAFELTQIMFDKAESGEWDSISEIEAERDQIIQCFFSEYHGERTLELESLVKEIQTINQNILRLVLSARDGLRMEMSQFKQAGKAARAYIQHSY